MKKLFVVVLSFLMVATIFSATQKTGWEEYGKKGKVKERLEIESVLEKEFGEDVKRITRKIISKYDEKGNLIEKDVLHSDGSPINKEIYTYNGVGNKIDWEKYLTGRKSWEFKETYKYDDTGNKIECLYYQSGMSSPETIYSMKNIYKYDDNGNQIEENTYFGDKLKYRTIFKYYDKGDTVERARYNADGSLDFKKILKYDEKGNLIQDAIQGNIVKYIYKYDNKGNMIEFASFDKNGKPNGIRENNYSPDYSKLIYKYNDEGNWIEKVTYYNENILKTNTASYTYY